ncbi:hypothetical protein CF319_g696 [Tilletia indica]|nr:hypothetical protein CF319_g696 [Tilletia indica]
MASKRTNSPRCRLLEDGARAVTWPASPASESSACDGSNNDLGDLDDSLEEELEEIFYSDRPYFMFDEAYCNMLAERERLQQKYLQHPSKVGVNKMQATSNSTRLSTPEGQVDVWRIKTDPETSTLIATARQGGLFVVDINTSQAIWQLGKQEVPEFMHLEAEQGVLILFKPVEGDEHFKDVQIWVHRRLLPDEGDGALYQRSSNLHMSQTVVASRFKWPVFCGMGDLGTAFFWDLTNPHQPRQLHSFDASSRHSDVREINDVDFDDQHLFLVGSSPDQVTVYDRATVGVKWSMAAYLRQANAACLIRSYKVKMADLREDEIAGRLAITDFFERKLLHK